MRTRTFVSLAVLLAVSIAQGQAQIDPATEQPAAAPAITPPPATNGEPEITIKELGTTAGGAVKSRDASGYDTLSVDFPDEDVRNILRNVADLFELNLVIPEELQGKASIKLRDVTWRQIFEVVLAPVGYTYIEEGNIIKVISNDTLLQEPVATEVFIINYARAADIMPTITSLVDPAAGGRIVVDARSNSLVITERPSRMNRIRPIIEQLDRATDQVMIESKFVEVTDRDVKNLGVNWASLNAYNIAVGGDEQGVVGGYEREQTAERTNGESGNTNTTGTQGTTSTSANTVTSTNGVTTATSSTGVTSTIGNETATSLDLLNSLVGGSTTSRTLNAVFSADQFGIVLSALQTLGNTKIVSNPTIVTLNNTEASINVGEERPIPNYTFSEQTGTFQISGFTYKPIGVLLKVTPQVNARGMIKLTLSPEVSQTNGNVTFGGASGTQIPIVATRKATTQVSLKNGYTMGIGGLVTQNATKGETKVPVLGSVPVLGRLFRSDTRESTTSNLIIFITAKSLSAEGAPVEEIFESSRVRQLEMKREDLPGHRDGSDPFVPPVPVEPETKKKSKWFGRK
ncbi:MAG TPA: secretin N-terminal domain-containing protein [Opitutus sp.]|nr:secretin N-terminal domain-containing protein [Opitutus sp.]